MLVNIERIMKDIETLAGYSDTPGKGVTRFSYTENDRKARNYLIAELKKINIVPETDSIGNIRARLEGTDPEAPVVLMGSHIDSVKNGGKLDGVLGVVGALEVLRIVSERKIHVACPLELIIFAEEEGSNFNTTMVGSKMLMGKYKEEDLDLLLDSNGRSIIERAEDFDLDTSDLENIHLIPEEIKVMLELHIEQGKVLENKKTSIGIVNRIAGMCTLEIKINGIGNHAGATPMDLRSDALVAVSEMIVAVKDLTMEPDNKDAVATVGKITCYPNASNVIPEEVIFTIDIRDTDSKIIKDFKQKIGEKIILISEYYGVDFEIKTIGESAPGQLDQGIINFIAKAAEESEIPYLHMNSGAVHDSCLLADKIPTGMIFIPSLNGRSHVPEEYSSDEDIGRGCELLLSTALAISK